MKISIVIPVYGCPEALKPLHSRLTETLLKITKSYEIILVNDGCPKNSWKEIQEICADDKKVVGVNLSRNFGQIHSTNAGMAMAKGEYVVLMDCDLQERPESIVVLYSVINEGYDIVFARRKGRKDNPVTLFLSQAFYKVYNALVDGYYDGEIGNLCIVRKHIVDQYNKIKDNNKSFTTVVSWMGFRTRIIDVESDERFAGKSSYNLSKKINLAIDMLTSQSNKPLKLVVGVGVIISLLSFIYLFIKVVSYFVYHDVTEGWTSIIGAVFLMGGLTLISLGVVGIYIGNIFNQTKGNPEYLIQETLNKKNTKNDE